MNWDMSDERIRDAVRSTETLRLPKQSLATFGTTNIYYYLVTEPIYTELVKDTAETVIREGRVIAERPKVVTPYYLSRIHGFSSEARKYFEMLTQNQGETPGLFYSYRNEPKELNIVSGNMTAVVDRINADIDRHGDPLASIIKGEDELWDVSLMKFIYDITRGSMPDNINQLGSRGLLSIDSSGVPAAARRGIEELFSKVSHGDAEPGELKEELDRWNLFEDYEDRFFTLFGRK